MSIEVISQIVEAFAVVVGVGFAIIQIKQYKLNKRREAALVLLHSFQTPSFAKALNLVYKLPDGLSKRQIEDQLGDDFHLVYALMTTWESLGILVYRGEIDLDMIDDFFSGPIIISWNKLKGHIIEERSFLGRDTIEEWFQWLMEQLLEQESKEPAIPAYIAHKKWKHNHSPLK
jgi:hypothetical protein